MEGGDIELDNLDRTPDYSEYDNMNNNELGDAFQELLNNDSIDRSDPTFVYVSNEMVRRGLSTETYLGEASGETSLLSLPEPTDEDRAMLRISEFTHQNHGINIDRNTDAWFEIRRRIGISKLGNITFRKSAASASGIVKNGDIVLKRGTDGKFEYNTATTKQDATNEFRRLIEQGVKETRERNETTAGLPSMVETAGSYKDDSRLTAEENREMRGAMNPTATMDPESRIGPKGALRIQMDYFDQKIDNETMRLAELNGRPGATEIQNHIDGLRDAKGALYHQLELEEALARQEEDVTRLMKIKKYLRENVLGLSALGITVAAFITSIAIAARGAVVKGAQATRDFGKWLADKLKNLPPWLASLGSLLVTILKAGAAGISWLSRNLWAVVVFVLFLLYDYIRERRRRRR